MSGARYDDARPYGIGALAGAVVVTGLQMVKAGVAWPADDAVGERIEPGVAANTWVFAYDSLNLITLIFIAAAYMFGCIWLLQARINAELLRPQVKHRLGRMWIWVSWVCPGLQLWYPMLVVRDVSVASRAAHHVVGPWWAAFLVWMASTVLSMPWGFDATGATISPVMETLCAVAAVLSCGLWMRVINEVDRGQTSIWGGR